MIKAIGFDLWETLITDTPEVSRQQEQRRLERLESLLRAGGCEHAAEIIERAYRDCWTRCFELYWSADVDIPTRTQIVHFLEELEIGPSSFSEDELLELEEVYAIAALEIPPKTVDGAHEILGRLKRENFRVGLISNTGRTPGYVLRRILEDNGLAASIDVMLFSNEHGECKPRPSIFARLREGLEVSPGEIAFVGDNLYVDVFGAQQAGMFGIHFAPERRGTAVAPTVAHDLEIVPHATIRSLGELPDVIESLGS